MALTPADVANKQFHRALRGYDLDEVDGFLDEVESELARLLRENAELRQVGSGPAGGAATGGSVLDELRAATGAAPAADLAATTGTGPARGVAPATDVVATSGAPDAGGPATGGPSLAPGAAADLARAEAPDGLAVAATVPTAPTAAASVDVPLEGHETALRTLLLAQRTADAAVAEARAEAAKIVAQARRRSEEADRTIADRIAATLGDLEVRRRELEVRVAELRSFEREYRTRMTAYLESQLRELVAGAGPATVAVRQAAPAAPVPVEAVGAAGPAALGAAPTAPGAAALTGPPAPTGPPREAPERARPAEAAAPSVGPFTVLPGRNVDSVPDPPDPGQNVPGPVEEH